MERATPREIADRLRRAIPRSIVRSVEIDGESVEIDCGHQPIMGGDTSVWWQQADGWQFNIYAPRLIYEQWSLEPPTIKDCEEFATVVEDLFAGQIVVETWWFRRSGKHWRTRLIDPRLPAGQQVITTYNKQVWRWFRAVRVERATFAAG